MAKLDILEHKSSSYAPRTYANANNSHVTMALAADPNTGGERCTHKAAGSKLIKMDLADEWIVNSRKLWHKLVGSGLIGKSILNVAGNGMATLNKHGYTQEYVNDYVLKLIEKVHTYYHIDKIISGGQTGVDIAGAWAGYRLGIDTQVLLPKGYLQRHEDGVDRVHTQDDIRKQITGEY